MNFEKLCDVILEAKGTKPGERYQSVQKASGPAAYSASPVGRADNFELPTFDKKDPADQGRGDEKSIIGLLDKGFRLLKNDDVFEDQIKGIMNGFKKNRHQISAYQESVLKSKPKTIDNLWGEINRLTKVVNNPEMKERADIGNYIDELNKAIELKDEHQKILDDVYDQIDGVTERNEELNNEYLEQLLIAVKHTTKRIYSHLNRQLQELPVEDENAYIPLIDWDKAQLAKEIDKSLEAQLKILEMFMSNEKYENPLIGFFEIQEERYDDAKNRYFQLRRGDNYSVTTDQLYRNLPLFTFTNTFYSSILKSPVIKLTTKQSRITKGAEKGDDMMTILGNVKTEKQFDNLKPELLKYIDELETSDSQKSMLKSLANGPFVARKGSPSAAFKIRSSLKASNLTESFDDIASSLLKAASFDEDDFKLDLMEVCSLLEKKI